MSAHLSGWPPAPNPDFVDRGHLDREDDNLERQVVTYEEVFKSLEIYLTRFKLKELETFFVDFTVCKLQIGKFR